MSTATPVACIFRSSRWIALFFIGFSTLWMLIGGLVLLGGGVTSTSERAITLVVALPGVLPLAVGIGRISQRVVLSREGIRICHGFANNLTISWSELESWQLAFVDDSEGPHFVVNLKRCASKWKRSVLDNEAAVPSFAEFVASLRHFAPTLEITADAPPDRLSALAVPSTPKNSGSSC